VRRLTVHIGAPKTGSTYLQRLLYENREQLLREQGVLYPDVNLRGFGHHDLAFLIGGGYPDWAISQQKSLSTLAAELRTAVAGHCGDIILSSEDFYLFPQPEELRRLLHECGALDGREPRILVYIRRQDDAHESWYNQTVKAQGATHSLEESIEKDFRLWDYSAQLEQWAATFGRGAVCVRRFESAAFAGGTLRSDFLQHAGVVDTGLTPPPDEINVSLNRDLLEFQRSLNRLPLRTVQKRRFHRELMELSRHSAGQGIFDETPLLGSERRRAIMSSYRESNEQLSLTWFSGKPTFSDPDGQPETPATAGSGLTAGKLLRILTWLMLRR